VAVRDHGERGHPSQHVPWTRFLFLWVVFFLSGCGSSLAQDPGEETVISSPVTIEGKGDGGIVIAGQRYGVGESTAILDASGNRISLCDLLLPSEAEVEYRLEENLEPLCLRIEIIRVLKAPTNFVITDDPG